MRIERAGNVGAFVQDVDLRLVGAADLNALRSALAEHEVLFFRNQHLEPDDHLQLAQEWGSININRFFRAVEGYPAIAEVLKEPHQQGNIGGGWHTDHSYDVEPALGSMLYAREVPEHGGDTLFASVSSAYASLSEGLQRMLLRLRAVHSSRHVFGEAGGYSGQTEGRIGNAEAAVQDAVHPVVIKHPASGRPCLYVNPAFTLRFEGWSADESAPLLRYLYDVVGRPEHTYRLQWQPGTLAFWDNRSTWHWAVNDYQGSRRLMHRITLDGEPLSGLGSS